MANEDKRKQKTGDKAKQEFPKEPDEIRYPMRPSAQPQPIFTLKQVLWLLAGTLIVVLGLFILAGGWRLPIFRLLLIGLLIAGVFGYRLYRQRRRRG